MYCTDLLRKVGGGVYPEDLKNLLFDESCDRSRKRIEGKVGQGRGEGRGELGNELTAERRRELM
jgi:hypothetical protein